MKLSLRWIFDHLKADWKKYNVDHLVEQFNATTAEIEGFEKAELNLDIFALGKVIDFSDSGVTVECKEWKKQSTLSFRTDVKKGLYYLIKKDGTWASMIDVHGDKEGLLPALYCEEKESEGQWKKSIEKEDYILEVDNKSVTNRPDLWGHRGFAREFSALLGVELVPESEFLASFSFEKVEQKFTATKDQPFSIINSAPKICKRFATLYVSEVEHRNSMIGMAIRLLRVDARPIDFLVDATNYAMFDVGQPIHAFDADVIASKTIEPRCAQKGEKLTLLDAVQLELTEKDLVITDGNKPLALAGIKGGMDSGVTQKTTSLLIESANFDATSIRLSAARHKTRTEASSRFEKTLDPHQNVKGIQCFIKLLKNAGLKCEHAQKIISVGAETQPLTLKVEHDFIAKRLGVELKKEFIIKALTSLEMNVTESKGIYSVSVPTFRSTKDITLQEDIVEEVARLYGYKNIPLQLPKFSSSAVLQPHVALHFLIKNFLAFDGNMQEVENYAVADNEFLKKINWKIKNGLHLANPLSEQREIMVDSLIPHLLSNVADSMANYDELRFFESGSVWSVDKGNVIEKKVIAGLFYNKKAVDFYELKTILQRLFVALDVNVEWKKTENHPLWASLYQTADVSVNGRVIGQYGVVAKRITSRLGSGDIIAFELDVDSLRYRVKEEKSYKALSKYQATKLDISMIVPVAVTVADLSKTIAAADKRIYEVQLRDIFKKDDWKDKKSVTMRFVVRDDVQTLSKDDLDAVYKRVEKAVTKQGAEIR